MPTDETTLEALAALYEREAAHAELRNAVPRFARSAVEARLIADALRCKIASLTAPAAQEGVAPEYFDVATKHGVSVFVGGPQRITGDAIERTFTALLTNWDSIRPKQAPHRVRLFAEVAATLPRGGADV